MQQTYIGRKYTLLEDQDKLLAKICCFNTDLMKDKTNPKVSVSSTLLSPNKSKPHVEIEIGDEIDSDASSATSTEIGEKRKHASRVSQVTLNN